MIRKVVGLLDEIAGGYMLIWIAETRKFIILFIIVIEPSGVQFGLKSYPRDFN